MKAVMRTILLAVMFLALLGLSPLAAQDKWYPFTAQAVYKWGDTLVEDFSPPARANRNYLLGVSLPLVKNPYWVNIAYGIVSECKDLGCTPVILAAASYDDLPTQINQIENLRQRGVDAMLVGPISFEGTARAVEETIDRGIPVFMLAQTTKSDRISGVALANDYKLGYSLGQWVVRDSGGKANLVMLSGPSGITWTSLLSKGLRDAISGHPGIRVLDERWTEIDVAIGQSTMENMLQAYRDVTYVTAVDVLGHGAANALIAARKDKQVKLGMVYASEETFPYIRRGTVAIGYMEPTVILSRIVVDLAVRRLNGEDNVPYIINPESIGITKDNIEDLDWNNFFAPSNWRVPLSTGR